MENMELSTGILIDATIYYLTRTEYVIVIYTFGILEAKK